ncbi:cytochrome ubiquinol oxidase subunit I [Actinomadura hibisca]|uniref:cytochrome ubiquinol oxidase subunit I n=1 Tax=Actinomadura hibisca TaxID=68565 RepID=UPI0008325222|nr:cytochrome ubiquinol oxidase subunit I [Actinomadura hibisca]
MDALMLARVQFALTAGSHFLFVALTLGLATLVAFMQTRATVSGGAVSGGVVHARMVRFWGQLYVINYAVGIVTGLVMEFQFGVNWGGMSAVTGEVFGAPLAMETIAAFFVESTFLGLWIFGWDRLNRWVHLGLIWVVAVTAYLSAYFILVANGWLQRPVGFVLEDGRARLTDLGALLTNPTAVLAFWHVVFGGLLTAGVFVAAVSAYHLRRRTGEVEFFRRSMRVGLVALIVGAVVVPTPGGMQFAYVQPTKQGASEKGLAEQARFVAEFGPGDYLAPGGAKVGEVLMLVAWQLLMLVALAALVKVWSGRWLVRGRVFHVVLMLSVPLPYVAMLSGWVFREVGRQPWMVYGVLTTRDALSKVGPGWMAVSFTVFTVLMVVLLVVNVWLLARFARRGPEAVQLGAAPPVRPVEPVLTPSY